MRLPMTQEMRELRDKVDPYLVVIGLTVKLKENAPDEIKKAYEKYRKLSSQQMEEALRIEGYQV